MLQYIDFARKDIDVSVVSVIFIDQRFTMPKQINIITKELIFDRTPVI